MKLVLALVPSVALSLLGCARADAEPRVTVAVENSDLYLEEDGSEFFVELSRSQVFGTQIYSALRIVPWRFVRPRGEEAKVRMALGYGSAFSNQFRDALGEASYFFEGLTGFQEHTYFQLSLEEIESLLSYLERLESVPLLDPPESVSERFLQGNWGDLQFRKDDDGVFVSVPQAGWEPLPTERFKAGLKRAAAGLARLTSGKPSARL